MACAVCCMNCLFQDLHCRDGDEPADEYSEGEIDILGETLSAKLARAEQVI